MTLRLSVAAISLLLSGCGTTSVPVTGVASHGERYKGVATGTVNSSRFTMTGSTGLRCGGNYSRFTAGPSLAIAFRCSNGTTGQIDLIRGDDMLSGAGEARFSDGTSAQMTFGNNNGNGRGQ